ncbi:unnamed protein product [Sphenostylis stenocarpa]|uniref:Uncharacterized protein n=1 Tax=Sphenostylis stenocarpa TaxID=92480 RepID=A0AA86W5E7_9FABA|nr:unnamed protein product [Sphenostylis stenocarpa]
MAFRVSGVIRWASFSPTHAVSKRVEVLKGYLGVYAGDEMRRFMILNATIGWPHIPIDPNCLQPETDETKNLWLRPTGLYSSGTTLIRREPTLDACPYHEAL